MKTPGVYRKEDLDLWDTLREALESKPPGNIGAVLVFIGVARREGKGGKEVVKLEMESYEEHANNAIWKICYDVKRKFKVQLVSIHHLIGEFHIGEPVVLVVVGGTRRENILKAMRESIERYKTEPALFKKEVYVDDSHEWIY